MVKMSPLAVKQVFEALIAPGVVLIRLQNRFTFVNAPSAEACFRRRGVFCCVRFCIYSLSGGALRKAAFY